MGMPPPGHPLHPGMIAINGDPRFGYRANRDNYCIVYSCTTRITWLGPAMCTRCLRRSMGVDPDTDQRSAHELLHDVVDPTERLIRAVSYYTTMQTSPGSTQQAFDALDELCPGAIGSALELKWATVTNPSSITHWYADQAGRQEIPTLRVEFGRNRGSLAGHRWKTQRITTGWHFRGCGRPQTGRDSTDETQSGWILADGTLGTGDPSTTVASRVRSWDTMRTSMLCALARTLYSYQPFSGGS